MRMRDWRSWSSAATSWQPLRRPRPRQRPKRSLPTSRRRSRSCVPPSTRRARPPPAPSPKGRRIGRRSNRAGTSPPASLRRGEGSAVFPMRQERSGGLWLPSPFGGRAGDGGLLPVRLVVLVGAIIHQHVGGILLDFAEHRRDGDHAVARAEIDRKSTRLNSSHTVISYAVFCLKKKKTRQGKRHVSIRRLHH